MFTTLDERDNVNTPCNDILKTHGIGAIEQGIFRYL